MARSYYCTVCKYKKQTESKRGPVPLMCDECRATQPRTRKAIEPGTVVRKPVVASIEAQEKVTRALELRRDYRTWEQIARECGYSSAAVAYTAARQEMARRQETLHETIDDYREKELSRLEMAGAEVLRVMRNKHLVVSNGRVVFHGPEGQETELVDDGPVLAAVNTLVKVSESIRKLIGADAASKTEAQVNVNYTVEGIVETEMP